MGPEAYYLFDIHQCFFLRYGFIQIKTNFSSFKLEFKESSEDIHINNLSYTIVVSSFFGVIDFLSKIRTHMGRV